MQAFGRSLELQAAKVREATDRSEQLGGMVAVMLRPSPSERISASGLVEFLESETK